MPAVSDIVTIDKKAKCPCGRVVGLAARDEVDVLGRAHRVVVYRKHNLPTRYRMTAHGGTEPIKIKCSFSFQRYYGS